MGFLVVEASRYQPVYAPQPVAVDGSAAVGVERHTHVIGIGLGLGILVVRIESAAVAAKTH